MSVAKKCTHAFQSSTDKWCVGVCVCVCGWVGRWVGGWVGVGVGVGVWVWVGVGVCGGGGGCVRACVRRQSLGQSHGNLDAPTGLAIARIDGHSPTKLMLIVRHLSALTN